MPTITGLKTRVRQTFYPNFIDRLMRDVHGWTQPDKLQFLQDEVHALPNNARVVEIGVWHGRSALALGEACRGTNKHVYAIDPWQNYSEYDGTGIVSASGLNSFDEVYETFKSHIKNFKLEDYITPLRSFSLEIAKSWSYGPINLTFIDANHNYQPVLDDLRAWSRLTAGALCGDDWDFQLFSTECYYPVREAVYDFIKESQRYTLEIPCDNTWLLRDSKSAQIGPGLEAPPNNPF